MKYLEIYKLLDRSNCRECGFKTCSAFVHAVMNGGAKIGACTHLDRETVKELEKKIIVRDIEKEYANALGPLKKEIQNVDFKAVAKKLGARLDGKKLCINSLGKDLFIDLKGNIESIIHIHLWITVPLLRYIINGGGDGMTGKWVAFDQLKNGITMSNYFEKRCVEPLRQMADSHTDIFFDLLDVFGGRPADGLSADITRVIYPLPKLPFLFLYWKAEEEFESKLQILFDASADRYLDFEAVYILSRGLVEMFKKIIANHEEMMPNLMAM